MKVLETRTRPNGLRYRRYETDSGHRYNTIELPETVIRSVGIGKVLRYMEQWKRGEASRERNLRAKELIRQNVKPTAIAHELGCTEQRVRQIRKQLHEKIDPGTSQP